MSQDTSGQRTASEDRLPEATGDATLARAAHIVASQQDTLLKLSIAAMRVIAHP